VSELFPFYCANSLLTDPRSIRALARIIVRNLMDQGSAGAIARPWS